MAYQKINFQNEPSTQTPLSAENLNHMEQGIYDAHQGLNDLQGLAYGPLMAATVADMTDEERVYVYTGSESGYVSGNWYYYNGSSWVSGGVYNAVAVSTDKTLSISDKAADAKVTGDAIGNLDNAFSDLGSAYLGAWERGRLNASGVPIDSTDAIRTKDFASVVGGKECLSLRDLENPPSASLYIDLYEYSSNDDASFIKHNNGLYGRVNVITLDASTKYVKMVLRGAPAFEFEVPVSYGDSIYFYNKIGSLAEYVNEITTTPHNALATGTDIDTLTTFGIWWINSSLTYTNLPVGMTSGALINLKTHEASDTIRLQVAYSKNDNKIYFRYRVSTGWGEWSDNTEGLIRKINNMYDKTTDTTGYTIADNGTISANEYFEYSALIPVSPNKRYHVRSIASGEGTSRLKVFSYNSSEEFIRKEGEDAKASGESGEQFVNFITPSSAAYIRIVVRITNTETFISEGYCKQPLVVYEGNASLAPINSYSLKGKKLSILGASISTFADYIPAGYSAYYPHETTNANPVTDVHDTYWQKVIDATGMELLVDNASAGSFCTTGHGSDAMAGCGTRCESLHSGTVNPDVIIIQLGGNDFTRNTPLGSYDGTQTFPSDTTTFREAYAIMLNKITTKYKDAKVLCGTIPISKGGTYVSSTFPAKNTNNVLMEEFNKAIRELANLFGCGIVEFSKCGLTFNNVSKFMQDASGDYGQHPNRFGHSMMANEVLHVLGQEFAEVYPNY